MDIVSLFVAFLIGFIIAWGLMALQLKKNRSELSEQINKLTADNAAAQTANAMLKDTLSEKQTEIISLQHNLEQMQLLASNRGMEIASLNATNKNLTDNMKVLTEDAELKRKQLTTEFELIAGKIMKQRSDEFEINNRKSLDEILAPLRERIHSFEKKVEDTYDKELRDKIGLREELKKLTELNARVSEEANNLTRALKGDVKKQGNWGEVVLERVLERSGLTKGQEYEREQVVEGSDYNVQRPDVIIHLPDNKHIIIDSKVSLVAYDRFIAATSDEQRTAALKEHIASLRMHVKLLGDKNYQNALNINAPDFVLMFIPIEASFSVAVQADAELFAYAWERKIVIVSPTTLLATLRTISSIWKQENQTRNAQEIARLSGALYDKFVGFAEDMAKIKLNIDRSSVAYDDAMRKMKEGNGNLIRTAERIKELGAKTGNKSLPQSDD